MLPAWHWYTGIRVDRLMENGEMIGNVRFTQGQYYGLRGERELGPFSSRDEAMDHVERAK